MRTITYDSACWSLALNFLSDFPKLDTDKNRYLLSAAIQQTIEHMIEHELKPFMPHAQERAL